MNKLLQHARGLVALAIASMFSASALAQGYPSQPVKILVGFSPGGTTDVMGRLAAQELGAACRRGRYA